MKFLIFRRFLLLYQLTQLTNLVNSFAKYRSLSLTKIGYNKKVYLIIYTFQVYIIKYIYVHVVHKKQAASIYAN